MRTETYDQMIRASELAMAGDAYMANMEKQLFLKESGAWAVPRKLQQMITKMVCWDEDKRPSVSELMMDEFF